MGMISLPFTVLKSTMASKADKIRQQMAQLAEQLKQAQAAEEQQKRKDDTRRKILVGSMVLSLVEQGKLFDQAALQKLLDEHLTRNADRKLFDLAPLLKPDDTVTEQPEALLPNPEEVTAEELEVSLPSLSSAPVQSRQQLATALMNGAYPATRTSASVQPAQSRSASSLVKKSPTPAALPLDDSGA